MNNAAKKSMKNISFLLPLHIIQILSNFILKTTFIRILGQEYLGINVLFGDITTLLSLTELGLNSSILYALYRPLELNDKRKISAIINYSRTMFNKIALAIMLIGLAIIPFLKFIVNSQIPLKMVIWYYILYLITVAVTYLSTYKTTLISADEKNYIVKIYFTVFNVIRVTAQIISLFLLKNFTIYLIIGIISNLLFNLSISIKVNKMYPYLNKNKNIKLEKEERRVLHKNTTSVFKHKISGLILNNTDNILISNLISTSIVGQYSGYTTLKTTLSGLVTNFQSGINSSIGKLNVLDSEKHKYITFNYVNIMMYIIAAITSICFYLLADNFIVLWIGPEYILDKNILISIVMAFYINIITYPIETYKYTTELFKDVQGIAIATAISNIILSIILGKIYGLIGILVATVISNIITKVWADPFVLFKKYFNVNTKEYVLYMIKLIIQACWVAIICWGFGKVSDLYQVTNWLSLFKKGIIVFFIVSLIILISTLIDNNFRSIIIKIKQKKFK